MDQLDQWWIPLLVDHHKGPISTRSEVGRGTLMGELVPGKTKLDWSVQFTLVRTMTLGWFQPDDISRMFEHTPALEQQRASRVGVERSRSVTPQLVFMAVR
ncbi:hypothetical protein POX_h09853 [Penicillium oxalicum]|uniref:hypothetical protein n=1 Tax=Penicillium oxalicum TaxID=69781 RepID=UPI0020B679A1|nr:hypothetical protein POX_h09853 [Penicillium oxalicum]KAI2786086.1 hypothetical protein POX_h09853 [Penicillium oxalicum]